MRVNGNIVIFLVLLISVTGIVLFSVGLSQIDAYPYPVEYDRYSIYNCTVHNGDIGRLNICKTDSWYDDEYMAVWNITVGNLTAVTMVTKPTDHHVNMSLAIQDLENGPTSDNEILCMCDLSYVSNYPILNDNNEISCDVWDACIYDISYIQKLQSRAMHYRNIGEGLIYTAVILVLLCTMFAMGYLICYETDRNI